MASTAAEKTAEELKREIDELHQKQREINERLRDPRNLRRNFGGNGGGIAPRQRGYIRPADRFDSEDQPPPKRRLSSAVVKVKDGVVIEEIPDGAAQNGKEEVTGDGDSNVNDRRYSNLHRQRGGFGRGDGSRRSRTARDDIKKDDVLKILSKATDPNRNRRMFGSILGTLEKFQKEDQQLSSTEAYMRRSDSLQRAEQRAREESENLRQQEREKIAEKRREDLTLRARVSAKAEEKKLELLFLHWSQHHNNLGNYLRTKAEPQIYYMPKKPLEEDPSVAEQRKEKAFQEWKAARREELTEYQKQIEEQYLEKVELEFERWQNARKRGGNNNNNNNLAAADLQETMDKELETHQAEHGPKTTRKVVGNNDDDEEDVEDINVGEDDIMDDVLDVTSNKPDEAGNVSPVLDDI
ncbi:hypothetical protein ACHQM5_016447 [Ranunculus cassubicifolius]